MPCPTWYQCGKLLRISYIIKQTQDETDSERDKNHWYDDDFNNEKTRSLWFRDIGSVRKIHTKLTSIKEEKNTPLTLPNPKYKEIIKQHQYLRVINMNERDTKSDLLIHMVLGINDIKDIKDSITRRTSSWTNTIRMGNYFSGEWSRFKQSKAVKNIYWWLWKSLQPRYIGSLRWATIPWRHCL